MQVAVIAVTSNAGAIATALAERVDALRNLRPALLDIAAEVDRRTAEAFERSRRVDGLPFADLADSTKLARLRRRKGAYRKAQGGKKATPEERKQSIAAAIKAAQFKPLVDTGRMRNSARARVVMPGSVRWSIVEYGVPHIVGGKNWRPPQRNPSVFRVVNGRWLMFGDFSAYVIQRITRHVSASQVAT